LSDSLAKIKKNVELKPLQITSRIHPISEKEPCHSCENRNPGSGLIFWIPASAGMTTLNNSIVKSLNLGHYKFGMILPWQIEFKLGRFFPGR
jgi:hypothetical protein